MNLKEDRKNLNISQLLLAKISGISQGYISSIECGYRTPDGARLVKIKQALEEIKKEKSENDKEQ